MSEDFEVVLEVEVCQGTGYCEQLLPAVFRVGDAGVVELLRQPIGAQELELARQAEDLCPTRAIRLTPGAYPR